jgi:hypothetical protein
MPKTRQKKARRTKMVAVQTMFHDQRIVEEDEVFMFTGHDLPDKHIAVKAGEDAPLGVPQEEGPSGVPGYKPAWTTEGFVKKATRESGQNEADDQDE